MEPVRLEIAPEVNLDYVRSDKFKTGTLSVQLITPINEKTASFGALLPSVLRRGTMSHPDMRSLSTALDLLYGSSIGCTVRKKGENQCIGFAASFIDEEFVPGGEKLLEPMCDLLGELLLDPVTRNGRFLNDYVESEKQNLIDAIRGIINDKRDYADLRLLQEMCRGERYGVDKFGSIARVEKITNQTLFRYYQELLSTAHLELFYCGSAERERVEEAISRAFAPLQRGRVVPPVIAEKKNAPETPRDQVQQTGYGIVMPSTEELTLEEPEIVRQGGRYGVRLRASAPSIHLLSANIRAEVNPIVGSEKQSEELVHYLLSEFRDAPEKIWETNIFGKSLSELVREELSHKLSRMPDDARSKIRETLEKIINENAGGLICIIL